MKIKRFLDKDSRGAMAKVRAEMGGDAVILSSKNVNGQVELVAAMDFDEKTLEERLESSLDSEARKDSVHNFSHPLDTRQSATPDVSNEQSPTLTDLQRELGNLRGMLETELAQLSWKDMAGRPSVKAALYNRLAKLGLSRAICGAITDKLPAVGDLETHWTKALGMLARRVKVMGDSMLNEGGIVALVGSTGVGKTTTIAKLAARFVMRHGTKQVALITTDCYRIGGQEQLETFANYLGIPMIVATDGPQLKAALDQLSSRKLVLIDTAGMSQRDVRLYEQFATLKSVGYNIDAYVVLSATAQQGSLNEVVQVFGKQALAGAMITKVDESSSLGAVLDVVVKNDLKLGYVSIGQKVPEDIIPARVEYLIAKAVELMEMEAEYADSKNKNDRVTRSIAV
ncbi:MAG: flagellar biosynthesis protein FlhF [Porticoccaceae bacterium]|nr:MAG: flagellar biosynthesis protein FlhF [Porticoccaceae bacterium]